MGSFVYCLNCSTIRPTGLLEKIRLAGKYGFAAIELWLNEVVEYVDSGGSVEDVRRAIDDQGLMVASAIALKGWSDATKEAYPAELESCRRSMDLAARLGAPYIIATPSREWVDLDVVGRRYRDLLELGRQAGVRPAMEFLGFCKSVWRVDQAWQVMRAADPTMDEPPRPADAELDSASHSTRATIVLDAFHLFRGGSDIEDLKMIPADRIAIYHLDDAPAGIACTEQTDADRVMPGDGVLDLKWQMNLLAAAGYMGPVSLELFNRELWTKDPDEVVRMGMEKMRRLFDGIG